MTIETDTLILRRAVEIALREFPDLSDNALADLCGVANHTVKAARPATLETFQPEKRTGADGKQYPARRELKQVSSDDTWGDAALIPTWRQTARNRFEDSLHGPIDPWRGCRHGGGLAAACGLVGMLWYYPHELQTEHKRTG